MEAFVVAIERGDAVHRVVVDRARQLAREHGAVAGQIALPILVAGAGVGVDALPGRPPCRPAPFPARPGAAVPLPSWRACPGRRSAAASRVFISQLCRQRACRLVQIGRAWRWVSLRARPLSPSPSCGSGCAAPACGDGTRACALRGMDGGNGARRQIQNLFGLASAPSGARAGLRPGRGWAGGSDAAPRPRWSWPRVLADLVGFGAHLARGAQQPLAFRHRLAHQRARVMLGLGGAFADQGLRPGARVLQRRAIRLASSALAASLASFSCSASRAKLR